MKNCMNTHEDEGLNKRLQELMENPPIARDDSLFNADNNFSSKTISFPQLKDLQSITLSLPAAEYPIYSDGSVTIRIQAKDGALIKDGQFIFYIYSEDYFPMCNSEENGKITYHRNNDVSIGMSCRFVWLPGNYTLFLRDKSNSSLTRINFEIEDSMNIVQQQPISCMTCGIEDVLTNCVENIEPNWDLIATTPGASQLRKYALESRQLKIYNEFRKSLNGKELNCNRNLLIYTTNKDWNEKTLEAFQKLSVPGHYFTYLDCATLYNAGQVNPYEMLYEKFNNTTKQVYCLTNMGALLNTGGKVIVKRVVEKMHEDGDNYKLWLCGTRQEIDSVMEVNPSLKEFFMRDAIIEQQAYTGFELVQSFFKKLEAEHLELAEQAKDALSRAVFKRYQQGRFCSWSVSDTHRFVVEEIRSRYTHRVINNIIESTVSLPLVTLEDIPLDLLQDSSNTFEDSVRQLNEMVGLDNIKQSIITMANQTRFFIERRNAGFHTSNNSTHHAIFTGNPGTGKTTVAKLLGKIYHAIGLLSKGEVLCVDRTRLVGRFIGETEENMKTVLEEARGNVLFIDEAYNLSEGTADRKDYGHKVIDSLLTVLAQPNPDMVIIFAGYEKEMDAMLNTNPGLMGRFPYKYRFSDYTAEQLMEIALHLLAKDDYILSAKAEAVLRQKICDTLSHRTKNFSNARWVEQFVRNGIVPAMADRIVRSPSSSTSCQDYQQVLPIDIEAGYRQFNPRMVELRPIRQVGFNA